MNRVVYSVLIAFLVTLLVSPLLISILHKLKFGQNIREEGPKSHQKKQGTPTMGGIIFILTTCLTMFIFVKNPNDEAMIALYSLLAFGAIGFLDDILMIIKKKNEGLKSYQKMILLLVVSCFLGYYAINKIGTDIMIPFAKFTFDLKIFFIPFLLIYFISVTNAVNLTDGLDGLSSSITLLVMTFFALVSFGMGYYTLSIFCALLSGSLLGFLRFNAYPAQIIMGDTGALALGGAVAAVAMVLKLELLLIIVGGVYVMETLSVIIQVFSFKVFGKRVFKMSPLHHHFELSGWHESKIVAIFSIATVILCLIGFLSITY